MMRRVSWKVLSSSHCGLEVWRLLATRLCSRSQTVCIRPSPRSELTRGSPLEKQGGSWAVRRQSKVVMSGGGSSSPSLVRWLSSWPPSKARRNLASASEEP
ncbi:unnamed protein product [Ixodes persulcatus]